MCHEAIPRGGHGVAQPMQAVRCAIVQIVYGGMIIMTLSRFKSLKIEVLEVQDGVLVSFAAYIAPGPLRGLNEHFYVLRDFSRNGM